MAIETEIRLHKVKNGYLIHVHSEEYPNGANFVSHEISSALAILGDLCSETPKVAHLQPVEGKP